MPNNFTSAVRELAYEDLPMVLTWRNHESVRRFMYTQHTISAEEHYNWFEKIHLEKTHNLIIVEDGEYQIGFVHFSRTQDFHIADWGFYANPFLGKGVGRILGVSALNFAFGPLGLHKVCGQAILSNDASCRFHKRLGFLQEGVLRDQKLISGVFHSLACFGLLKSEWKFSELNESIT